MFKRTLTPSDFFIIVPNLLPVIGVWFFGWNPKGIFIVYCLETIIIGIFNLVKMGIVTIYRKTDTWYNEGRQTKQSGLLFMFFFLVHYGIFVAVQMGIFFAVSGIADEYHIGFFSFFYKWPQLLSSDTWLLLGVFFLAYGFRTVRDFVLTREYKTIPLMLLMFQPYPRIFVQQITVLLGSMFLVFGAGKIFILIFAIVKIFFELYVNYGGFLKKALRRQ
jgi:hypothetical protein